MLSKLLLQYMGVQLSATGSIHITVSVKEILFPFDIQIFGPDASA